MESTDLSDIFEWSSRAWLLGAVAALPVIDGGRRKAGIEASSAELEGEVARYREQILIAFKDVEDQLAALRLLAEQSEAQGEGGASAEPLDRAFRRALPQRLRQPARPARCVAQRAAQPPPSPASPLGAIPEHGRAGAGTRRQLGRESPSAPSGAIWFQL
jgi:hypothetical protein